MRSLLNTCTSEVNVQSAAQSELGGGLYSCKRNKLLGFAKNRWETCFPSLVNHWKIKDLLLENFAVSDWTLGLGNSRLRD